MRPHIPEAKYAVAYCEASIRAAELIRAVSLDAAYWDKVIAHWKEELGFAKRGSRCKTAGK